MAEGLENQVSGIAATGVDAGVDPVLLAIVLAMFLAGAVGPFVALMWGAVRDRRAAASAVEPTAEPMPAEPAPMDNPVEPTVVPAADPFSVAPLGETATEDPANDDGPADVSGDAPEQRREATGSQ